MQAEKSVLDNSKKSIEWYGHLLRVEDSRWPKKIYQWTLHGRRRGRWQQSWKNQVINFMRGRNILVKEDMTEDHLWRLAMAV